MIQLTKQLCYTNGDTCLRNIEYKGEYKKQVTIKLCVAFWFFLETYSVLLYMRITSISISISIASKHFLISIRRHTLLAFIALPNLFIWMVICYFQQHY